MRNRLLASWTRATGPWPRASENKDPGELSTPIGNSPPKQLTADAKAQVRRHLYFIVETVFRRTAYIERMTGPTIGLVVLQAVGTVSLLPYPAILVANVMQIAAEGPRGFERLTAALPYVLLSLYPVVWIGLYVWSWRAMAHGSSARPFVLSSVPAVLSLAGAGWFLQWGREDRERDKAHLERIRREVEAANPLVWLVMRSGGPSEFPGAALLPADAVISEMSEAPNINGAAGEHGTPLAIALRYLGSKAAGPSR